MLIVLLVSLACRLSLPASIEPSETIPVSTQAVATLEAKFDQAMEQIIQGQAVELSISEEELTSLLAQKLDEQHEIMLADPQIYLRDGQVQLFGNVQNGRLKLPLQVVLVPQVDSTGRASFELVTVKMGVISVPDSLVDTIQNQADQLLDDYVQGAGDSLIVENIIVGNGILKIRAHQP